MKIIRVRNCAKCPFIAIKFLPGRGTRFVCRMAFCKKGGCQEEKVIYKREIIQDWCPLEEEEE